MTNLIQKTGHVIPDDIAEVFKGFTNSGDSLSRDALIKDLRLKQWTLQSIALVSGVTRERVRQIAKDTSVETGGWSFEVPSPPAKTVPQGREYVEPDPVVLERLLELQPAAQRVRANSKENRAEAEEYTRLVWEQHNGGGVTLYRLAKRLGVTHGALRFRLARYGYKQPKTGTSKVYAPIKAENRV